ncbi:hypothetical protein CBR64_15510 [Cellulosimicrobium cellulans]|jgi:hypothetical protein|uniref:Uncharacterized protein n=1 Tax=Cellulosimicrobium cellulans TaxID=1710 RepID=A0A1Y0HWT6_CELCE|nr:hypothetical protein [Cellulosimicrobium cellulans]ARU52648.1 hypothetical protein CBR64_15510 [Cellulosimicrobium cellulans]
MTESTHTGTPPTGRVARLWLDTDDGEPRPVGHLVTRVCTHWDTVGPQAFPRHVNPEPRVQWRAHLDDADPALAEDLYSDDPEAPPLPREDGDDLVVRGRRLRVEWLDGAEAADAWAQHGW